MSDTSDTDQAQAEPVDAEFEPAPGSRAKPKAAKPKKAGSGRGLPWLTIAVVTVAASSIGGGTGWLIGRYAPDATDAALEERLVALEASTEAATAAATQAVSDVSALDALQTRLNAIEGQLTTAQLRAEGLEAVIREVATLRGRVEVLEATPTGTSPAPTENGPDATELAALENRLNIALVALDERLETLTTDTASALQIATDAQGSVEQALAQIAQQNEADVAEDEAQEEAASTAALDQVETRVTALEGAVGRLLVQGAEIEALEAAIAELGTVSTEDSGISTGIIEDLSTRLSTLEAALTTLSEAADNTEAVPTPTTSNLAERALAFAAVSRAAAGSEPFPVAVADLQRIWPRAPGSAALTAPARTGAPTLDQLVASFPANEVRAATGESQMWLGVIRVEREGTTGPTPAIEAALEAGNLAGAVAAVRALDDEAEAAAADWLEQAEARLAIEDSLIALANALSRAEEQG